MISTLFALLAVLLPATLQTPDLPYAFPRDGAKQLIDNERVTVWDVVQEKEKPTAMHRHKYDFVGVDLADASVKVTKPDKSSAINSRRVGQVFSGQKGLPESQEGTSDTPRHSIIIDLKEVVVPPLRN